MIGVELQLPKSLISLPFSLLPLRGEYSLVKVLRISLRPSSSGSFLSVLTLIKSYISFKVKKHKGAFVFVSEWQLHWRVLNFSSSTRHFFTIFTNRTFVSKNISCSSSYQHLWCWKYVFLPFPVGNICMSRTKFKNNSVLSSFDI